MSGDRDDPILDACLDEVLAGKSPPDLSPRILQAWAANSNSHAHDAPEPPPVMVRVPRPVDGTPSHSIAAGRDRQRAEHRSSTTMLIAVAAGILGLGLAVGIVALVRFNQSPIARAPANSTPQALPESKAIVESVLPEAPKDEIQPSKLDQRAEAPRLVQQASDQPSTAPASPDAAPSDSIAPRVPASTLAASPPPRRYPPPSSDREIVSFVNAELGRTWAEAGVKPTPAVNDAQWCRRLFTRLLGRAPTDDEETSFADDKSTDRREKLVRHLLTDPNYSEEFASHWSTILTNVFMGRRRPGPNSPASREEMQKYFVAALSADKPYSQIATELVTATGSSRPGADDYNPAVHFLLSGLTADATVATARISRVLLGHQLQCAQCHGHPTQNWSQEQFWSLNACIRGLRAVPNDDGHRLVMDAKPAGAFFETPDGLMKSALPRFLDGTEIAAAGDRRAELARLAVESDDFSKAGVNRIWAALFDYGFTRPVDDLGPNSSPTAPRVLDRLATEFASHGFDLKAPIRWAVLTEPFNRSSTITDVASRDMPEEGEAALFSRYYTRPPQAPQAAGSLAQAVQVRRRGGSASEMQQARVDWLTQANRAPTKGLPKGPGKVGANKVGPNKPGSNKPGSNKLSPKTASPSPPIASRSTEVLHRSVAGDPTGMLKKLAASSLPYDKKIDHLFLAALGRQPGPVERRATEELLTASKENQSAALEDTWWALLNSQECILDR